MSFAAAEIYTKEKKKEKAKCEAWGGGAECI
jgi:hypothetical protein